MPDRCRKTCSYRNTDRKLRNNKLVMFHASRPAIRVRNQVADSRKQHTRYSEAINGGTKNQKNLEIRSVFDKK